MNKVKIADLQGRLGEYLREVQHGKVYTVMDGKTPIAQLTPYRAVAESVTVRKPLRRVPTLQSVRLPGPLEIEVDPVALLLEERQIDR